MGTPKRGGRVLATIAMQWRGILAALRERQKKGGGDRKSAPYRRIRRNILDRKLIRRSRGGS